MFKTVINGHQTFAIPVNTPDHVIAAIPDLSGSETDYLGVIDPLSSETRRVYRNPIKEAPPKVDAKTYQYVKDLMSANSAQEVEDNFDEIAADRIQNAVDLVLLDVIHDHVDQVLEATVQKATLSVLAEYLKDDEVD